MPTGNGDDMIKEKETDNYKTLMDCANIARHDIIDYRIKKNITRGQDPAVPQLEFIGDPWGEDSVKTMTCYAIGNLQSWSAAKLLGSKSSLSGSKLEKFEEKNKEIKGCKTFMKNVCEGKKSIPPEQEIRAFISKH